MKVKTLAVVGECMIELQRNAGGMACRFGGDTLNTAVYLRRLLDPARFDIAYVTGLGEDALSGEMMDAWRDEGIATRWVQRLPDKLPGIYMIETDARGERRFHYWRKDSAARYWLHGPDADAVRNGIAGADCVYFSGISLAILSPSDRAILFELLEQARAGGARVVFDNNYRPRLWESRDAACDAFDRAFALTDIALVTLEDDEALYGVAQAETVCARLLAQGVGEVVIKRGEKSCLVATRDERHECTPPEVADIVDTTAAGDSFAAAYLAARLTGAGLAAAAQAGHRLAAAVIRHPGAIIPRSAMPA